MQGVDSFCSPQTGPPRPGPDHVPAPGRTAEAGAADPGPGPGTAVTAMARLAGATAGAVVARVVAAGGLATGSANRVGHTTLPAGEGLDLVVRIVSESGGLLQFLQGPLLPLRQGQGGLWAVLTWRRGILWRLVRGLV